MSVDVTQLTRGVASGDPEALARFYEAYFDLMYREAWRVARQDEAFCLDVVQDAMLRVIRALGPMDAEARLVAWLRTVVRTTALDRLRSEVRRRRREAGAAEAAAAGTAGAGEAAPERNPSLAESIAWLERELGAVDQAHAQMLVLRYKLGWTLRRIGAVFDLTPGAVDGRINRLMASLRRRAGEDSHDEP